MTQGAQSRERDLGEGFSGEGTYVYLSLIHADVWQKPTQYYKVIILQLKLFFKKEEFEEIGRAHV